MSPEINFVDDIIAGKIDWTLKVRVINLWNVFNPRNNDEVNYVDMLLLDEKCGKIQATIKKHLVVKFAGYMEEGRTYLIHKLMVAQNDPKYRKTDHKYKLFFMGMTRICNISAEEIPTNHFSFRDFSKIQAEMKADVICDVIGHVVEKDTLKDIEKNGKRMMLIDIVVEDLQQCRLPCTLWGEHAERVNTYLATVAHSGPVPIILQLVRLNSYKGVMAVSSAFYGTKIIFDDETLPEIVDYKSRMSGYTSSMSQAITQIAVPNTLTIAEELLQTPRMTISDLLEASDTGFGTVLARVIEIELDQGWVYDSCNTCLKRVTQCGAKYACENCDTMVAASPRFKLQLQVIDHTGSTTFTLFNTIVSMYVGRSAVDLIRSIRQQLEHSPASPDEFKAFIGKEFLFKVEVSEGNILRGWQTFTVKKITHDAGIIHEFIRKYDIQITSEEDDGLYAEQLNTLASSHPVASLDDIDFSRNSVLELPAPEDTPLTKRSFVASPSPTTEDTPPSKTYGKRGSSIIDPIEFPDLDSTSPSPIKAPKVNPDLNSIDFGNLDFTTPPTNKLPKVVVKVERNGSK